MEKAGAAGRGIPVIFLHPLAPFPQTYYLFYAGGGAFYAWLASQHS